MHERVAKQQTRRQVISHTQMIWLLLTSIAVALNELLRI